LLDILSICGSFFIISKEKVKYSIFLASKRSIWGHADVPNLAFGTSAPGSASLHCVSVLRQRKGSAKGLLLTVVWLRSLVRGFGKDF